MKIINISLLLAIFHIYLIQAASPDAPHLLWPMPSNYSYGSINITISSPCNFNFRVTTGNEIPQMDELFTQYREFMFPSDICRHINSDIIIENKKFHLNLVKIRQNKANSLIDSTLNIHITNTNDIAMRLNADESYSLILNSAGFNLSSTSYIGFVRGLETFSQIVSMKNNSGKYTWNVPLTPINIYDYPRFPHRGYMLDTSRNFQTKERILQILDGLMYSKLNVFHWHITDSDSFPIFIPSHPNLTIFGAFSAEEVYSFEDVQEIVDYATTRAIRIIPELDSPAHTRSWWLAPEFSELFTCTSNDFYMGTPLGQIDPTLNASYSMVGDILAAYENYFPGEFIHLGADEVLGECWGERS